MNVNVESERLQNDLHQVVNEAEELLTEIAGTTASGLDSIRDRVETRLRAVKTKLDDAKDDVTERAKQANEATQEFVGEHVWQSLAVAAAVGVVIGMLIRRH